MSHDQHFPDSDESPEARSARAVAALEYEERAGLGFRRRARAALGNPWGAGEAERAQIDRDQTGAELWAGYLAGIGTVLGGAAIFYKPLLMGMLAVVFCVLGSIGDGIGARIARVGLVVACVGFSIGMMLCIFVTKKGVW